MRVPPSFWTVVGIVFLLGSSPAADKPADPPKPVGLKPDPPKEPERPREQLPVLYTARKYAERAETYYEKGDFQQSVIDFTEAIKLEQKDAYMFYCRANSFYRLKQFDEAVEDYSKAIELNKNFVHALFNRGIVYHEKKKYELAINDYTAAIQLNPLHDTAFHNRGNIYYEVGKFDEAIADYSKCIDLNFRNSSAFNNRGNAYDEKGKYALALADYLESIRIDPKGDIGPANLKILIKKLKDKSIKVTIEGVTLDREVRYVETKNKIVSLDEGQSMTVSEELTVKHEVAFTTADRVEIGVQRSEKSKNESSSQYSSAETKTGNGRLGPSWLNIGGEIGKSTGETWGTIRGWESEMCNSIRTSIEHSKTWTKGVETKNTVSITINGRPDERKVRVIWRDEYRTGTAKVSIDGTTIEFPIAFRIGSDIITETVKATAEKK